MILLGLAKKRVKSVLQYFSHCIRSVCLFTFQGGQETRKESEAVNAEDICWCLITPHPEERRARRGEMEKGSGAAAQDSSQ